MKSKYFLIGFVLLLVISFSVAVRGADAEWKVPEDELFIYEIKSFDEDLADDVFVNDDIEYLLGTDAEVGAMYAQMITDVDDTDDYNNDATEDDPGWVIEGWYWKYNTWTDDEDDFEDPDPTDIYEYTDIRIPQDPDEYGAMIPGWELFLVLILSYTGCPSPADDWLGDIDWADVDDDGSSLSYEWDSSTLPNADEDYETIYTWSNDGIYDGMQALNSDGEVIYEVERQKSLLERIPGYELPVLLGITAITSIGLIFISTKKKL